MRGYLPMLLMMGAFGAYAWWMTQKRKNAVANIGPALRNFFERTGYKFKEAESGTLEDQVRLSEQKIASMMSGKGGNFEQDLVRDFHGMKVRNKQFMGTRAVDGNNAYVMSCDWFAEAAPRIHWQAAAKSLHSVGKMVKEAFGNSKRQWEAIYPHEVKSGDAELDAKLSFWGEDPDAVKRVLATPGLKEALLGCVETDLVVSARGASFSDPSQKNLRAGMGGTLGAMAVGLDYGKLFDLTIPVHDRIAELLALSVRAST